MVGKDAEALRYHEQLALEGYLAAGRTTDAIRARQAFVLALVLVGDYETALEQQGAAIDRFRQDVSHTEVADSQTLLSAILFLLLTEGIFLPASFRGASPSWPISMRRRSIR